MNALFEDLRNFLKSSRSASLRAGLRRKERFFPFPALSLSERSARLGNVPGYYRSRLAALGRSEV